MFIADDKRYEKMVYRNAGKSGLKLPVISLGLWQNFGAENNFANIENMCRTAFNNGITYFDIANNYGNPYFGSAEENFGKVLKNGLGEYRDEIIVATKAGYDMWPGPYGTKGGSRKYLTASINQSLKRTGLEYFDIFYHHVYDPDTPLEETALALDSFVKQGKALYIGISNYDKSATSEILKIFRELKTPFIINQPMYSMLHRWIEPDGLYDLAKDESFGLAAYCPLQQGLLTNKYLNGIPENSRAASNDWVKQMITEDTVSKINQLNELAASRGQTLTQMALSWILREDNFTTALIGASRPEQIEENAKAAQKLTFTDDELKKIDEITGWEQN